MKLTLIVARRTYLRGTNGIAGNGSRRRRFYLRNRRVASRRRRQSGFRAHGNARAVLMGSMVSRLGNRRPLRAATMPWQIANRA